VLDVQPDNDERRHWLHLGGVNLTARLTGDQAAEPGRQVAYSVGVVNNSQADYATEVTVISRPPAGLRVTTASGATVLEDGRLQWRVPELAAGGSREFAVAVEVPESAPVGTLFQHEVTVASAEPDTYPPDNTGLLTTRVVAGPPASVLLELAATDLQACVPEPTTAAAIVRDRLGHPVADGTLVRWTASGASMAAAVSAVEDGRAGNQFTPGSRPGLASVRAEAGGIVETVALQLAPGPIRVMAVTAAPSIVPAGGSTTVAVNVLDACANAVADGQTIRLAAERGTFSGGRSWIELPTRLGRASGRLAVGDSPGPLRVEATHGGVRGEAMVSVGRQTATPAAPEPATLYLPFALRLPD
jgi:uncharacterized repeat protein (TIGR01451 family)